MEREAIVSTISTAFCESPLTAGDAERLLDCRRFPELQPLFTRICPMHGAAGDFDRLREILDRFSRIPYENISKIIKLDRHFLTLERLRFPPEVLEDHLRHGLGGTCFSLTFTLQALLAGEGFSCYPVLADMSWGENVHSALIVDLEGVAYLADPGYLLAMPLALPERGTVLLETPTHRVELDRTGDGRLELSTIETGVRKFRYRFSASPASPFQFLQNWLASFYWSSLNAVCLTRREGDRMVYIHRDYMREMDREGKRNTNLKRDLHRIVAERFSIAAGWVEAAQAAAQANKVRKRELGLWRPKEVR